MEATLSSKHAQTAGLTSEELCRLHAAKVCRFAAIVSANSADADDLAQDVLVRAVRSLGSYDPTRGSIEAWLWRIVVNAAKDSARRRLRVRELLASLSFSAERESESVEDAVLTRMRDADLHAHMRRMAHRDRILLGLRYGIGLETDEVGAALGLSADSAGKAIRRALARLRARLKEAQP